MESMFKRKIILIFLIMLLLSLTGAVMVKVLYDDKAVSENKITIATSFYPMYILTLNITEGIDGIEVINLTENQSGCIHDYHLTTKDMRVLSSVDIFIMNGGGIESFIGQALINYPDIRIITASDGIPMLKGTTHEHTDSTDEHDDSTDEHNEDEYEGYEEYEGYKEYNSHIWMSLNLYLSQINTITEELIQYDNKNKYNYIANKNKYTDKISLIQDELLKLNKIVQGEKIIIFHDAFAYLAEDLGMDIVYALAMDEDSGLKAREVAEIINLINEYNIKYLWVESEYADIIENAIAKEVYVKLCIIDPITGGDTDLNAYIDAYKKNIMTIETIMSK